jgi:sterol 24-C-methyltransferase
MLSTDNPTPKQDSQKDSFLSRLSVKNTDKSAHKATVDSYFNYFDKKDSKILDSSSRTTQSDKLTNNYYDLATDFYEYGWGTSFHFAPIFRDSTYAQCLSRHEDYLALKLKLKPEETCLDVGCGVGGPMREIAKFSGAKVVGLNNNEYQVGRCQVFGKRFGLETLTRVNKTITLTLGKTIT